MGKVIWLKPAKRDDPIYKEGLTISTPRSHRSSTKTLRPRDKVTSLDPGPPEKRLVCPPPELVLEDEYPLPDTWLESAKRAKIKPPAKPKPKADK